MRELLDRTLIFGRRHLESVLLEFIDHYNQPRPHQGIEQRRPWEPADMVPPPTGPMERRDRLGGIIHEYSRAA
jgi:putative transposase